MSETADTLGQRLRAERERKGFSAQKAADQLHLDGWVIEALENGDYARIGPAVYGKGHLKRYAGLLGLPAAEILAAYDTRSAVPVPAAPSSTLRLRTATTEGRVMPWGFMAGGIALIAIVAALAWRRPWQPAARTNAVSAVPAAEPNGVNREPEADAGIAHGAPSGAAAAESAHGMVPVVSSPAAPGAVVALGTAVSGSGAGSMAARGATAAGESDSTMGVGRARLRLSFSADSWVDIHDASGRRLYTGYGRANSVKSITGAAPLQVYLGFAHGVQLEVNNRAVAIGPQFVAGDGARFAAGADGVLRVAARDTAADPHPRG